MVNLPLSQEDENRRLRLQQSLDEKKYKISEFFKTSLCKHWTTTLLETNVPVAQWCNDCGAYRLWKESEWNDIWILPKANRQ